MLYRNIAGTFTPSDRDPHIMPEFIPMIIGQTQPPKPLTKTASGLYVIAMCDVLGFQNIINAKSLASVYDRYLAIRGQVAAFQSMQGFQPGGKPPIEVFSGAVFSDTIMLWAPAIGAPEVLSMCTSLLVATSLHSMPLRVGIAFGECVIDSANDIFIGKPIVNAFETEQRQNWFGGAYHPSCWTAPGFRERLEYIGRAVPYAVPLKPEDKGPQLTHALNWTCFADNALAALASHEGRASEEKHKIKWRNARAFYDSQRLTDPATARQDT